MADKTGIQWTDATWNPIAGCSIVSPACTNCYAMAQAARIVRCAAGLGRETHYADTVTTVKGKPVWTGALRCAPDHVLTQPLRWRRPRRIFVNSMSDLFHEAVPDDWIDRVFAVMALAPQHTFQILTKRPERMRAYMLSEGKVWSIFRAVRAYIDDEYRENARFVDDETPWPWPLPNVWLGVTAERQQEADERIPILLDTPAAKRFVSIEPMLGPVHLGYLGWPNADRTSRRTGCSALTGAHYADGEYTHKTPRLDWVICGGESGPHARPMHPDWARSLRDQCGAAGVPFFFKQWGEWGPRRTNDPKATRGLRAADGGHFVEGWDGWDPKSEEVMFNSGKSRAGRLLDGLTHDALPEGVR